MSAVRFDTVSWLPGAVIFGTQNGFGVRADAIPATGLSGPAYAYSSLTLPADAAKEICGRITAWPSAGNLTAYDDTSFVFAGAPDGTYTFTWQLYKDGTASGSPQVSTLTVGAPGKSFAIRRLQALRNIGL